jgi:hypothetical protein
VPAALTSVSEATDHLKFPHVPGFRLTLPGGGSAANEPQVPVDNDPMVREAVDCVPPVALGAAGETAHPVPSAPRITTNNTVPAQFFIGTLLGFRLQERHNLRYAAG